MKIIGYCYHSDNIITFGWAKSDHIKRLLQYYSFYIDKSILAQAMLVTRREKILFTWKGVKLTSKMISINIQTLSYHQETC